MSWESVKVEARLVNYQDYKLDSFERASCIAAENSSISSIVESSGGMMMTVESGRLLVRGECLSSTVPPASPAFHGPLNHP